MPVQHGGAGRCQPRPQVFAPGQVGARPKVGRADGIAGCTVDLAAWLLPFIHQRDLKAMLPRRNGRTHAGGTATQDNQIKRRGHPFNAPSCRMQKRPTVHAQDDRA